MCSKWYLGTGGGDGRSTFFESWDEAKLSKYSVDPSSYDHTNISSRPSILINQYHSNRTPYLTMIFLWDEEVDHLLSSRYDPLDAGIGEAGMPRATEECNSPIENVSPIFSSLVTNKLASRSRSKLSKINTKTNKANKGTNSFDLKDTMKEMIDLLSQDSNKTSPSKCNKKNNLLESLSLSDLLRLLETHKNHYNFLKENDLLTEERKKNILQDIDEAHQSISVLQRNKRLRPDSDDNNSNSISSVS